ncbi:delta-like protein A [Mytilus trossulus]|uniref:delta-like protein A n=1 Tax=Mytilus trossulus TaxID=6551 RepID=UPI0030073D30
MYKTFWMGFIASILLSFVSFVCSEPKAPSSPCDTNPCSNGGTCNYQPPTGKSTFTCTCSPNYSGALCDQEIIDDSLSDGEIAGIVVGCVVLLVLIVVIAIVIWKCCCKKSKSVPM